MSIVPTYVTFEQAKLLKEKGFDVECTYHYGLVNNHISIGSDIPGTNWNKRIEDHMDEVELFSRPEEWQVVEWLRVKYGIWIYCKEEQKNKWLYFYYNGVGYTSSSKIFNTPQEAYSAAFDYILKEIL